MKKLLMGFVALMLLSVPMVKADNQRLIINGETIEKTVARITFEGDLVVLHFADSGERKEDMNTVKISFTNATSINDLTTYNMRGVVDGKLYLEGLTQGAEVLIFDATGKQLKRTTSNVIDVTNLKTGVYVLKADKQVVKFMKR
jgi:hypothetical protein